jgi:hypothetical protein
VGPSLAATFIAEIGDIWRFEGNADLRLTAYKMAVVGTQHNPGHPRSLPAQASSGQKAP